jgi:hypothetical protein
MQAAAGLRGAVGNFFVLLQFEQFSGLWAFHVYLIAPSDTAVLCLLAATSK